MKVFYPLFLFFFMASCTTTRLHYIGNSYPARQQVDVYVDPTSVQKSFTVVGKGYIDHNALTGDKYINKIQGLAVAKAKQKGADAILIQDYYTPAPAMDLQSTLRTDSMGRGRITVGNTTVQPSSEQNFIVLFLKYN